MRFPPRSWFLPRAAFAVLTLWLAGMAAAGEIVPQFTLRTWQRADGLPSNEITGLCQDQEGFLWIATPNGLARFDGSHFRQHRFSTENASVVRFVALVADPAGDGVWAAPQEGGLVRFRQGRFETVAMPEGFAGRRVARFFAAADGALWLALEGGGVLRLHAGRCEAFGPADGFGPQRSTVFASDGAGRVWLANQSRLYWYEAGAIHLLPLEGVTDDLRIASARQDGPWVLTRGWLHKIAEGQVAKKIQVNSNFNANSVQALLEDSQGAIWTGSRARGVRRLTLPDENSDLVVAEPEDIWVLFEDRTGNIWAGANGGGLVRVRPGMVRHLDKSQGLLESNTLSVCEDRAGTIWIANREGGVAYVNEQGRIRTLAAPRMRDTFVARSVAPAGDSGVWAATNHGVLRADRTGLLPVDAPDSPPQPGHHGQLRVSYLARNGDLWVALEPGRLGRLRAGAWQEITTAEGVPELRPVQAIAEDADGHIWIGNENTELCRFDGTRFVRQPLTVPPGTGGIQAIHFDGKGACWLGTEGAGLIQLGAPPGRCLDAAHGLPTNNLTQVISDDGGSLWCGSPDGIFRVRREEAEKFFAGTLQRVDAMLLGRDEGLPSVTCASVHQPSVWKGHDGLLWFATREGVVAVDPRRDPVSDAPLVVKIDSVRAEGQAWPAGAPVRVTGQIRTLELDYSVLCLANPERVRARIKLENYDEEWTVADPRGLARYARLPPGEYDFIVEAHLAGVTGTSARARLNIVVVAAWWQTWWFRLGLVGAVLGASGLAVRAWSHRRLRTRLAELERASALERERSRIAQNIHDDLGSGLTRISLLTQAAPGSDGRTQLEKIYRTVSGLTRSMDEIVWAVNPKNDNLEGFANYLVEYAQGFLTDAGIRCRVSLPDVLPPRPLPAQFRHHLFLSCKEALNNVAKHAQATEVAIQLRVDGELLALSVADNGRGLGAGTPTGPARTGVQNGLANMHSRLAELGGACAVHSTAKGTTVSFTAPLPKEPLVP